MDNQCTQIMMLRRRLQRKLAPQRYEHTLSVSFTCMSLAMRYGCDMDKAELAGLLHDCGKRFSDEIILKKCLRLTNKVMILVWVIVIVKTVTIMLYQLVLV